MDNDLLQSQIRDSCRLALPEGLRDLMSDISREVLRAQPEHLCQFIADYLSALLVARENLTIASGICRGTICTGACYRELGDELRYLGVSDEEAEMAKQVITEYFEKGHVNEPNLMLRIANIANIDKDLLEDVKNAIRMAFKRHLVNNTTYFESSSDSEIDDVERAARHTLHMYRQTEISTVEYNKTAENVKASYRAYGVRRSVCSQNNPKEFEEMSGRALRFSTENSASNGTQLIQTASSVTLAGSYLRLPKYVPYSVHNSEVLDHLPESPEQERANITYTDDFPEKKERVYLNKKISFHEKIHKIEISTVDADDEASEKSVKHLTHLYENNDHSDFDDDHKIEHVEQEDDTFILNNRRQID